MNIQLLPHRFDVAPLAQELATHPEVWDQYRWRTEHPRSPHREASDIWVRYNALENLGPRFNDEHESVWYPVVADLPSARHLAYEVMGKVGGKTLGGVLITKIPAGREVYPHIDRGWHAESYEKFAIQVVGNKEQSFCFPSESLRTETGESFWFNNQQTHWVCNPSTEDRITLIICIRRTH